jgi:hypothetical protein
MKMSELYAGKKSAKAVFKAFSRSQAASRETTLLKFWRIFEQGDIAGSDNVV